jgi:ATP-dependent DNA helicase RecQ
MKKEQREQVQDWFMTDVVDVIVATNAFGMGVDKPDVRFVVHYDVPEAPDAYFQEIGRAGRDRQPAKALLLYRPEDAGMRKAMASSGKLAEDQVETVLTAIQDAPRGGVDAKDLAAQLSEENENLSAAKVAKAINRLEEIGAVKVSADGQVTATRKRVNVEKAAGAAVEEQEAYRRYRVGRVEIMKGYAESDECRRHYLLNYFGEPSDDLCNHCDNCETGLAKKHFAETAKATENGHPFPPNAKVTHKKFGQGTVMRYEGDKIVILFDTEGYKSLVLDVVLENNLLQPAAT